MSTDPVGSRRTTYTFDAFALDVAAGELRRGRDTIPLRPKCFDLLLFLVSRPGELISKERLLDEIWPDVVIHDATLSRTVTELREALGDDAQEPRFIETVPRRGYRFIVPVAASSSAERGAEPFILVSGVKQFPLTIGEHVVGRAREASVPVFTAAASRNHARLIVTADSITVEDLGSRNGTFVNGSRVTAATPLRAGDQLKVGGETFVVWSAAEESAPTADEIHWA